MRSTSNSLLTLTITMQTTGAASQDPQSLEEQPNPAETGQLVYYDYKNSPRKKMIIVCCDGTWNSEHFKQPHTNVSRTARAIKPYYEPRPDERNKRPCPRGAIPAWHRNWHLPVCANQGCSAGQRFVSTYSHRIFGARLMLRDRHSAKHSRGLSVHLSQLQPWRSK